MRVQAWLSIVADEMAWSMFSEETDHGRTSRTTIEPDGKGRILWVVTGFEEPEPHTMVLACTLLLKHDPVDGRMSLHTNIQITRVLINSGRGLADSRVTDIFKLGVGGSMLKHRKTMTF